MPIITKFIKDHRFRKIISMFLQFAVQIWWINKKKRFITVEKYHKQTKAIYRKQAVAFTNTATELGGLLIKLGQFFSSRVDVLPEEYISELAKLQDAVKPVGTKEIIQRIEEEYSRPISEIYTNFSQEPVASASLGQVHTADILAHTKVAVKILRPGIEAIIQTDFKALRFIVTFAKRYPKLSASVDLEQIYDEFVETTLDELDYIKEGQHADMFRANFSDDSRISVPEVYWEYTTQRVLTMEYVSGCKVNDYKALERLGLDPTQIADTLIFAYVQQLLSDAFFHADPHPGNLLVKADGTLVFIDFGMVGRIEKGMRENLVAFVMALFKKDTDQMVTVFEKLGFLRPHADKQTLAKGLKVILGNVFDDPNLSKVNSEELLLELREFMYSMPFQIPARTLFLGKSLLTIVGICGGLNPHLDFIKTLRPYAEELLSGEESGTGTQGFILDQAKKTLSEVVTLPEKLNRLITKLEDGEIRIHPSRSFELNLLKNQTDQASHIVGAIFSCGFLISGVISLEGPYPQVGLALLVLSALTFASFLKRNSNSAGQKRMGRRPRFHP
ncbi:MAG TPA: AarF/ABC1/UbiB kinase family protein [Desulfosporosinus sp.]|nr:AarF/ABC1/UbiB kinase family protein [Desulfosporosinus sp.]